MARKNSLQEFVATLSDWRSVSPFLFAGSTSAPLVDLYAHIGPIWPAGIAAFSAVVGGGSNLVAFHMMHEWSQSRVRKSVLKGLSLCFMAVLAYLILWTMWAVPGERDNGRIAVGWKVNPETVRVLEASKTLTGLVDPPRTARDLLDVAIRNSTGRSESDVALDYYDTTGVFVTRWLLLLLWATAVAALAWSCMAFTIYHRRHVVRDIRPTPIVEPAVDQLNDTSHDSVTASIG